MAFTNEQIKSHIDSRWNPTGGYGDAEITADMDKFGVDPSQVAAAYGWNKDYVQSRYDKAAPDGLYATKQFNPAATKQFKPAATKFSDPFAYNQKNPYLEQMASTITGQVNDNLQRNIMPNISGGAQMVGGFGGSRQGVVEANALKDANTSLSNSLTGMYYGDYNNSMNRQLQKYGMDQSYNLGLGQLQLGNRNTDLNQVQLGANLFNQGNQGMMSQGQGVYNLGLTQQQAPWQVVGGFNSALTPYTGYGTQSMSQNGSTAGNLFGGALAGAQLYNAIK